jgi:hypothetical protein
VTATLLALALVGLVPGVRAAAIDFKARRWAWGLLDVLWALAAALGLVLFVAIYDFTPTGL